MRLPTATYRLQLNRDFPFHAAGNIVEYLDQLGISNIYASPITRARSGSSHGYDVVDPNEINPELGGEQAFADLIEKLHSHDMGWLQDIVPNHMAIASDNTYLMDILEKGERSRYYSFFDIDWHHPLEGMRDRLLLPVLGKFYAECLVEGEIQLVLDEAGLGVRYYDFRLPMRVESYGPILEKHLDRMEKHLGDNDPGFLKYLANLHYVRALAASDARNLSDQMERARSTLWELYRSDDRIRSFLDDNLAEFNGSPGDTSSFDALDQLLLDQRYRLAFWKVATEEINYRRFFTVNDLISVRVEEESVFDEVHTLVLKLVEQGMVNGLRIDHIDGLHDPTQYLERLRRSIGDTYLIVEKILEAGERLRDSWPVQGTSGYESLNLINSVLCDRTNRDAFTRLYFKFTDLRESYESLLQEKKRLIIDRHMAGNIDILAHMLKSLSGQNRYGRDITLNGLRRALVEIMSHFTVYRTYVNHRGGSEDDRRQMKSALDRAMKERPDLQYELGFLGNFLLLEDEKRSDAERHKRIEFIMAFQQFTGPLMAKGLEDTIMYVYNRLISCNEVGSDPNRFGMAISDFHEQQQEHAASHPNSLVTTATHDTKRGEDVRARINVLSEIPREWENQLKLWTRINRPRRKKVAGRYVPDRNDEYFLYQTLIGTWPSGEINHEYVQRIQNYITKAVREAKVHTAWIKPDIEYENAYLDFVYKLLIGPRNNKFRDAFDPFCRKIAEHGIVNSLSQVVLKCTCPGVPDFYRGTELWDLNLVDPDNRRPVDFKQRHSMLDDIRKRIPTDRTGLIEELLENRIDGRIKLYVIHELLHFRRLNSDLFNRGNYEPVAVAGDRARHVVAFARRLRDRWAITVVPRFTTQLVTAGSLPVGDVVWGDTRISLPPESPLNWRDVISDSRLEGTTGTLPVADILSRVPVSVLESESHRG